MNCAVIAGRSTKKLIAAVVMAAVIGGFAGTAQAANWKSLQEDGLHDAEMPAVGLLQNPADALSVLPPDTAGNKVDWIRALQNRYIQPRSTLRSDTPVKLLDSTVLMKDTGAMPFVRFPHKPHTEWLDCSNCHEKPFVSKAGANPVNMFKILQGEYCGTCHGAVAFPLTECNRCHSVPRNTVNQ